MCSGHNNKMKKKKKKIPLGYGAVKAVAKKKKKLFSLSHRSSRSVEMKTIFLS